jgi:hypothetical protein
MRRALDPRSGDPSAIDGSRESFLHFASSIVHIPRSPTPVQRLSSIALFPGYQVEWDGKWIRIFRPDVECTNGVIHVLDGVFLKDSDIRVTGGASLATLAPHLIMILIAKWQL